MKKIKKLSISHFIPFDEEEAELMRAHEAGEYVRSPDADEKIAFFQKAFSAMREREKRKSVSIRLGARDIDRVKDYAKEENIPYQRVIFTLVRNFVDTLDRSQKRSMKHTTVKEKK